ncbi:hypothetical protein [Streptomyces sp. NPDC047108]|uniref:hypothetical protein n=1 Tax=Streptomyces sp. NPDC047108 TaxID=3155025 RepID=UPI00340F068F
MSTPNKEIPELVDPVPSSRARSLVLAAATAGCVLAGGTACSSTGIEPDTGSAGNGRAGTLTPVERRQTELVRSVLADPDPDAVFPDADRLGSMVGTKREGPLRAAFPSTLRPGQSVKIAVACTGGDQVTLSVDSGDGPKTTKVTCQRDDAAWSQPYFFTVGDGHVIVGITGHGTRGAMGFIAHGLAMDTGAARDTLLANRALRTLPDQDEGPGLGTTSGSLRNGPGASEVGVRRGQRITVRAACVGTGSIRIAAVSGRARATERVRCSSVEAGTAYVRLTAAGSDLRVHVTRGSGASGGAAYSIHRES